MVKKLIFARYRRHTSDQVSTIAQPAICGSWDIGLGSSTYKDSPQGVSEGWKVHPAQTLFLRAFAIPLPFNSSHVSVAHENRQVCGGR